MVSSFALAVLAVLVTSSAGTAHACSPEEGWRWVTIEEEWSAAAWVVTGDVVSTVDCFSYDGVVTVDPTGAGDEVDMEAMCKDLNDPWGPYGLALVRNLTWHKGGQVMECEQLVVTGFTDGAMCGVGLPWSLPERGRLFLCTIDSTNVANGTCIASLNTKGDIHIGYSSWFSEDDAIAKGTVEPTCPQAGTCQSMEVCKVGGKKHVPYEGSVNENTTTKFCKGRSSDECEEEPVCKWKGGDKQKCADQCQGYNEARCNHLEFGKWCRWRVGKQKCTNKCTGYNQARCTSATYESVCEWSDSRNACATKAV